MFNCCVNTKYIILSDRYKQTIGNNNNQCVIDIRKLLRKNLFKKKKMFTILWIIIIYYVNYMQSVILVVSTDVQFRP